MICCAVLQFSTAEIVFITLYYIKLLAKDYILTILRRVLETLVVSGIVADPDPVLMGNPNPDPDPLSTKDPCSLNFLVIKLSKIQFRPNNFFIFDFKCHRMFRFGKKMP